MPRQQRTIQSSPRQAAVQRYYLKGILPRNLGAIPRSGRLGDVTNGPGYVNNFWPKAINNKAPYVLSFDQLGAKLVPQSGLGDDSISAADIAALQGPAAGPDATDMTVMQAMAPAFIPGNNGLVVVQPAPPAQPKPAGVFDQLSAWLAKPLSPGSSLKNGHLVTAAGVLGLIAAKK